MNNFTTNLEKSVKEVSALIKENKIIHRAVKDLVKNIIIYDYCNDILMSENEMATGELLYKLNLYKKVMPDAYFIIKEDEVMLCNTIPKLDLILTAKNA
jgi:hypothetical protein